MNIIINHTSMVPIYEQIVEQIKKMVVSGELKPEDLLPSVRTLAKDLKISALTVKKAYDFLEEEGLTVTVHGKGTFVSAMNTEQMLEEQKKEIEGEFEKSIAKGKAYGISAGELKELFELVLED